VRVTFTSDGYNWDGYAPLPPTSGRSPVTLHWAFVVGELQDGQYRLVPD
jgi:hypothetical protein